ncbi:MAG: HEPN domain-containing protein [Deltaproteobacteria bacterium]|jgi:HEPN domain-containing protein|nr:HEPN domain-containing protein [Deltaproteobacteria bacterium]
MNHIDQADKLLLMASKDMKAMDLMILPESIDDEIFGFHAQQAVEKLLKAWITAIGGAYGFNHDLRVLVLTLRELGCDVEKFRHLIILNPFAVQMRYEPLETVDEQLDRPALRKEVQELHTHVQSVVALLKSKVWTTQ